MTRRVLAAVLAATVLVGCGDDTGVSGATATPVPVTSSDSPAPTPLSEPPASPSPTASASPTAEETASATPTPSPTTSGGATAAPDPAAALAAAVERRSSRPGCDPAGIVDDVHQVVSDRGDVLLVFVACFLGAYQANGELLAFDGQLREWPVEQWVDGAVIERTEVVGDVLAAPDGRVENLQLYRGLGDCGVLQTWAVEGERLALVEAREQVCDDGGQPPAAVTDWPVVYER